MKIKDFKNLSEHYDDFEIKIWNFDGENFDIEFYDVDYSNQIYLLGLKDKETNNKTER